MNSQRTRNALVAFAMLAFVGCGGDPPPAPAVAPGGSTPSTPIQDQKAHQFGLDLLQAILDGDEEKYVSLNLMKGDGSPDGRGIYVTQAGGTEPDENWTVQVREKYQGLRGWAEQHPGAVAGEVIKVNKPENPSPVQVAQGVIYSVDVVVKTGEEEFIFKSGYSVVTQRGRILQDDRGPEFVEGTTYESE